MTGTTAKDRFDWSGGHPALDFVNTLDERPSPAPVENLATYADLVRFAELAGLVSPGQARHLRKLSGPEAALASRRARELREHFFGALRLWSRRKKILPGTLADITAAIRDAHAARTLVPSRGQVLARHDWAAPYALDVPLHACALAIEDLLTTTDPGRIHKCGADDCDVYFLDKSKGGRRHWCSMKNCGNREKQRRWRADAE